MTEAEKKAKELVERFKGYHHALLCVDEILKAMYVANRGNPFWQQVKQAIEKL